MAHITSSNLFLTPYKRPIAKTKSTTPSIGNPGGGGGIGGGGSPPNWALHTKLIKTNKIEANFLLFCNIILRKNIKKSELPKILSIKCPFKCKNHR